ncbi:MAG: PrgI family protein [Peptococcaceae bacterium]|jgi:hypothetical protein|nr:PrgI family protein [Peptococcaceae bacterium]
MAKSYNTPPQRQYENKPIGGILTARQAAYILAGVALGLLFSSPLGRGMNLQTIIGKGLFVVVFGGLAAFIATYRVGEMPLDRYAWLVWHRMSATSRYPWSRDRGKLSAQQFLGIAEIRDGLIRRSDGTACLIMEVGGLNYFLMSGAEQDMVDDAIAKMLKPLNYPLTVHVQTRYLDAVEVLTHYREAQPEPEAPAGEYARHLMEHMENTLRQTGVLIRRYYFIFDSRSEATGSDLPARVAEMAAQLYRVRKIPARLLTTDQVADMVHIANNKERSRLFRVPEAAALGYFDLSVKGVGTDVAS